MAEGDGPLEHVVLLGGGVRGVHAQQAAQVGQEALRGGQLRGGHALPLGDEGVGVVQSSVGHVVLPLHVCVAANGGYDSSFVCLDEKGSFIGRAR